jgi:DNA-binding NarL/FixJ family response regulator
MTTTLMGPSILVADKRAIVRRGILDILASQSGFGLSAKAGDINDVIAKARALRPDIIVLGPLDEAHPAETCRHLLAELPGAKIVVLAGPEERANGLASLAPGVWGYVSGDASPEQLVKTIRSVSRGQAASANAGPGLSPREREILRLVASGTSNKGIAHSLSLTENTVKTHVKHILQKLHARNRAQAAAQAARWASLWTLSVGLIGLIPLICDRG